MINLEDTAISNNKEKRRVAQDVISLIRHESNTVDRKFLFCEDGKELCAKIQAVPDTCEKKDLENKISPEALKNSVDLNPYGYLLTQFAYYFRCSLIHASKPLALFSFEEEADGRCLRAINSLLEDFMEENLHLWFESNYLDTTLLPKASVTPYIKRNIKRIKKKKSVA